MNKKNHFLKVTVAAMMSTLLAGSAGHILLEALHVEVSLGRVYAAAFAVSILLAAIAFSRVMLVFGLFAAIGGGAAVALKQPDFLRECAVWLRSIDLTKLRGLRAASLGVFPSILAGGLLAVIFYVLVYRRSSAIAALAIELAVIIAGYILREDLSLVAAVPGLIASAAVFAWSGPASQDMLGGWRAFLPSVIAVCLALVLVPASGLTWQPMKDAA